MFPHPSLLAVPKGSPPPVPTYDNPNQHLSTQGMLITLGINLGVFVVLVAVFEIHRFYKQIYLKRLQKRFEDIGRVPPIPKDFAFGWLFAIFQVTEMDVLRMVGLDAYMLLRYHVVCYKLALFLSFWGILVLMPIYMTANLKTPQWDKYTLSNVLSGDQEAKYRLWAASIFGYVFAAYFMQLLYAEYNNFSVRRLQYLVQANPDSPQGDPDTPPQKYFTIMVERIPGHLRSAAALYKFFEKLFPGEVYNVEIALDLKELNSITRQRQAVRDSLEKAIAYYEATNIRPEVFIQTGKFTIFPDDSTGIASESKTWTSFIQSAIAPEIYGYEKLDSLSYYTNRLVELNKKVDEMQHVSFEYARKADKELAKKLRNKHDTRAAAVVEKVKSRTGMFAGTSGGDSAGDSGKNKSRGGKMGSKSRTGSGTDGGQGAGLGSVPGPRQSSTNSSNHKNPNNVTDKRNEKKNQLGFFEQILFGAPVQEYQSIAEAEMSKVEVQNYNYGPGLKEKGYAYGEDINKKSTIQYENTHILNRKSRGPIDISSSSDRNKGNERISGQQGDSTMSPMFASLHTSTNNNNTNNVNANNRNLQNSYNNNRRRVSEVTVVADPTGGYSMRHESIGSQDSDTNSYSTSSTQDLEQEDDNDPQTGRFIRSLSEAMRPENFDLLSGEYHVKGGDKSKRGEKGNNEIDGNSKKSGDFKGGKNVNNAGYYGHDNDDSIKPWSATEAIKKAAFGPATSKQYSTKPSTAHTSHHHSHHPPHYSQSIQTTLPPSPIIGRPPAGPNHQSSIPHPPLDPSRGTSPGSGMGSISGTGTGIAEGMGRTKVPFDGSLPMTNNDSQTDLEDGVSNKDLIQRRRRNDRDELNDEEGSDREGSEREVAISMEGDPTLREWMKTAQVNIKQELRLAEQRAEQFAADTNKQRLQVTKVVDINDLLDPTATTMPPMSLSLPSLSIPTLVSRSIQQPPGDFSGDLDSMNFSSHTPFSSSSSNINNQTYTTTSTSSGLLPHSSSTGSLKDIILSNNDSSNNNSNSNDMVNSSRSDNFYANELSMKSANPTLNPLHQSHLLDKNEKITSQIQIKTNTSIDTQEYDRNRIGLNNKDEILETREEYYRDGDNDVGGETYGYGDVDESGNRIIHGQGSRLERMGSTMSVSVGNTMSSISVLGNQMISQAANSSSQILTAEQLVEANKLAKVGVEKAKLAGKQGWAQTKIAGSGALQGIIEVERAFEMLTLGAYYKYSSTAFVTFNSRITESIAYQMLLSHDAMEINHAPNPNDIIWENVSIPKSQVRMRNYITNIGLVVGSLFWSTLVTSVNEFSARADLPQYQQQYLSVIIVLVFLLILPFIFDFLARNYEGMKLESEIQNAIMTRYFYYQLINVYVTVGFGGTNIISQILLILRDPQTLVDILGRTIPSVSLYFVNLVIVKIFSAVPLEMMRPWQLSTILMMGTFMDRRKCTRRELRTGAFYAWPMLYGWVYPQLMMVTMIMVTYSCIAPLLMPFCTLFFMFAYLMYKYQLLYVYINDYQSGGEMWYAVFSRSLIALLFAAFTLLGYLSLELNQTYLAGPFYFLLPLPFSIIYFWHYCEAKFKAPSMNLSFGFAKELDHRNDERRASGRPVPHDSFRKDLYRQPSLTERGVFPEPYRMDNTYDHLRGEDDEEMEEGGPPRSNIKKKGRVERGSLSLNVHEELDQGEENYRVMEAHFNEVVLPLAAEAPKPTVRKNNNGMNGPRGGKGRSVCLNQGWTADIESDEVENPMQTRPRS